MRTRSAAPLACVALLASVALAGCSGDDSVGEVPSTTRARHPAVPRAVGDRRPGPRTPRCPTSPSRWWPRGSSTGGTSGSCPTGRPWSPSDRGGSRWCRGCARGRSGATVRADLDDLFVQGEGGLMGMVVHPDFATSRAFTTCQTHQEGGDPEDIRLVTWRLSADGSSAERVRTLLSGLPISSGRHSGCRPEIAADGALLVGTGDVARGRLPQDRTQPGRQGAAARPRDREPVAGQPVRVGVEPARALRAQLRAPQRPGGGRAARHRCGLHGRARAAATTTRSTGSRPAPTTAGTRRRAAPSTATTRACR